MCHIIRCTNFNVYVTPPENKHTLLLQDLVNTFNNKLICETSRFTNFLLEYSKVCCTKPFFLNFGCGEYFC